MQRESYFKLCMSLKVLKLSHWWKNLQQRPLWMIFETFERRTAAVSECDLWHTADSCQWGEWWCSQLVSMHSDAILNLTQHVVWKHYHVEWLNTYYDLLFLVTVMQRSIFWHSVNCYYGINLGWYRIIKILTLHMRTLWTLCRFFHQKLILTNVYWRYLKIQNTSSFMATLTFKYFVFEVFINSEVSAYNF